MFSSVICIYDRTPYCFRILSPALHMTPTERRSFTADAIGNHLHLAIDRNYLRCFSKETRKEGWSSCPLIPEKFIQFVTEEKTTTCTSGKSGRTPIRTFAVRCFQGAGQAFPYAEA